MKVSIFRVFDVGSQKTSLNEHSDVRSTVKSWRLQKWWIDSANNDGVSSESRKYVFLTQKFSQNVMFCLHSRNSSGTTAMVLLQSVAHKGKFLISFVFHPMRVTLQMPEKNFVQSNMVIAINTMREREREKSNYCEQATRKQHSHAATRQTDLLV